MTSAYAAILTGNLVCILTYSYLFFRKDRSTVKLRWLAASAIILTTFPTALVNIPFDALNSEYKPREQVIEAVLSLTAAVFAVLSLKSKKNEN
jgi:undecaprenyl pyrophosphate phosphatase UppP